MKIHLPFRTIMPYPTMVTIRSDRSYLLGTLVVTAAVLVYFRSLWPAFQDFVTAIDFCSIAFCDFVVYYYEMGREVFTAKAPVLGYHYAPFFAIFLGVFGVLPLELATAAWAILLVAATVFFLILSFRLVIPSENRLFPLFLALVLLSFPHLHNFKWGQVSLLVTVLTLGTLHLSLKGKHGAAAIALAVAISLKYYPAVFVIPFLFTRNWRFLKAFLISCAVVFLAIPTIVLGWEQALSFSDQLLRGAYAKQLATSGSNSQSFVNVAIRWMNTLGYEGLAIRFAVRTISYLIVEGILALVLLISLAKKEKGLLWSFVLLFLSVPFFVATSWPHYLVYLPFCQLFLLREISFNFHNPPIYRRMAYSLLTLSIFSSTVFCFKLFDDWSGYTWSGLLFVSNVLLLVLSTWLLWSPTRGIVLSWMSRLLGNAVTLSGVPKR